MTRMNGVRVILVLGLLFSTLFASAHHGFSGRYDTSNPLYVVGVVETSSVQHPHPRLRLRVQPTRELPKSLPDIESIGDPDIMKRLTSPGGLANTVVEIEFPPVAVFFGWGKRIKTGDRVAIIVYRNCLKPDQWRGQWVRLADGTVLVRPLGRMQTEVRQR